MSEFTLGLVQGDRCHANGKVERRILLRVDGEQQLCERVTLDSDRSVSTAAHRWGERFQLPEAEVKAELQRLNLDVVAEAAERRARREAAGAEPERVSALADKFLAGLKPKWHRKAKSIFFDQVERDVAVGDVWCLADDQVIDAVSKTQEGFEMSGADSEPPIYRARLGLFKDAVRLGVSRLIKTLPEHTEVEKDRTITREHLLSKLVAFLIRDHPFMADCGTIRDSYHRWACGVAVGERWLQCFGHPVFARIVASEGQPEIAVVGEFLTEDVRYESKRKLAADLRHHKLAKTDNSLRCHGRVWRPWLLYQVVIDAVSTPESA